MTDSRTPRVRGQAVAIRALCAGLPVRIASLAPDMTVPGLFNASETPDVGVDLGSPVARDYFDRAPFPFTGELESLTIQLTEVSQ
ncbi:MAG: hypothetical protein ACYSWX_02635 [Planctomycetota bacterium]|jgi:arylsulfatase